MNIIQKIKNWFHSKFDSNRNEPLHTLISATTGSAMTSQFKEYTNKPVEGLGLEVYAKSLRGHCIVLGRTKYGMSDDPNAKKYDLYTCVICGLEISDGCENWIIINPQNGKGICISCKGIREEIHHTSMLHGE